MRWVKDRQLKDDEEERCGGVAGWLQLGNKKGLYAVVAKLLHVQLLRLEIQLGLSNR